MSAALLKYAPVIDVDLSANKIQFADAEEAGHRVQVSIPAATLNPCFSWNRTLGSDRPVGSADSAAFKAALEAALSTTYTDIDGMSNGLSFSSGVLKNADNISNNVNDLVMAYVLYKVYGESAYDTKNKVYNATDALNMVTNAAVADAVGDSIDANNDRGEAVDKMFRDLLAADPLRFFTSGGVQEPGLFETNVDVAGSGNWKLIADDILELKLDFTFVQPVSRRVVSSQQQPTTAGNTSGTRTETVTEQEVIPAGTNLRVRLQIKCT
jgi:hypothetical protein